MNREEDLIKAILRRTQEVGGTQKLTCARAFELAREFEVEVIEIGRICNRHNLKICKCQLGCFK